MASDDQVKESKDQVQEKEASIEKLLRNKAEIDRTIQEKFERPITVMFTDIVSSTEFFETRGDIEGRSMVQRHNDLLYPIIEKHGGRVVKGLGDGLMISFESPPAAARAAIEIQCALSVENKGKRSANQLWIKVAIHFGPGIVEAGDIYGDVVNTSSRICSLAKKGDILASQPYIDAVREEPDISHDYVGVRTLKGKAAPVDIHRILSDPLQGKDVRRSASAAAPGAKVDRQTMRLDFSLVEDHIHVTASPGGAPANSLPYSQDYPYRDTEVRTLVEQIELCLSTVDQQGRSSKENLLRLKGLGRSLYEILIPEGLSRFMAANPARALIMLLDNALVYVPWELLHDHEGFFCLKYGMGKIITGSHENLARMKDLNREPLRMLVAADPRGDLAATRTEGIVIQKELSKNHAATALSVDLRLREVTCEFMEAHLTDYDLFHYAGHSEHDSKDPFASGLMLADGKFEVGRLLSLARERPLPSLVFTNSCQSGLTENWSSGNGLGELADAFRISGIRHYIGSTIDLFDRSSAAFAEEFYRQLVRRTPVGEALRQARLKSISHYGEETLTWASYVLFGDPGFLYFSRPVSNAAPKKSLRSLPLKKAAMVAAALILPALGGIFIKSYMDFRSAELGASKQVFSLIHAGQMAQAEEALRPMGEKSSHYFEALSALHMGRGDIGKAEEAFSAARKDQPDSPYATVMNAHLALYKGSLGEAETAYGKAVDAGGMEAWQKAECYLGLGRVLLKQGSPSKALEAFDQALNLDPSYIHAHTAKGQALERLGKLADAVQSYEKATGINASDPVSAVLYRRSKEQLTELRTAERRERIDTLVSDLLKTYREGAKAADPGAGARDDWSSRPLYLFFIDLESKGQPALREGEDTFLSDQIVREVVDSNVRLHMVERALLDRLLDELKLSSTELADSTTALRMGKILAARVIATGAITRYKDQLRISLRAIDTETTRVSATASCTFQASEDPSSALQTMARDFGKRILTAYPIRSRISEVREGEVVLDVGSISGMEPGMKLRVVEKDARGVELTVKEVLDQSCIAVLSGGEALREGWRVEVLRP